MSRRLSFDFEGRAMIWEHYRRFVDFMIGLLPTTSNAPGLAFALAVPAVGAAGIGVDLGTAYIAQRKLDAAAYAAADAAIAQGRVIRAARGELPMDELTAKGVGRADVVFSAQKPPVRDIATKVTIGAVDGSNAYQAGVSYQASVGTVFLRLAGIGELKLTGTSKAVWVDRDAILEDRFDSVAGRVRDFVRVRTSEQDGWAVGAKSRGFGLGSMTLVDPASYDGGPPPAELKVAVELDTSDGNNFISKKVSLEQGLHQLRYWYRSLAPSAAIAPAWLCGTRALDVEWMKARDPSPAGDTNMVSAYLLPEAAGSPPVSENALGPAYRVDSCYSSGQRWIQRVVRIDVAARGDYRLAFRAEGKADGKGGAIANVLLCRDPCAHDDGAQRPASENPVWNVDQTLFEDRFDGEPATTQAAWASLPGEWVATPRNQVTRVRVGSETFVQLDAPLPEGGFENRQMSRAFLFTPGHYTLRYVYSVSSSHTGKSLCNYFGMPADGALVGRNAFTNAVTAYIDADRSVLHPAPTSGGGTQQTNWLNVAGAPENSFEGYRLPSLPRNTSAVDHCADQPNGGQIVREVNFNILRPGYYWVTFAGGGAADGVGGRVGRVQIVARQARDQSLWRIVSESTPWIPQVGAWLSMPTGAQGRAVFYRVQAQ